MSEILAIGVSHKTAPVAVRERLALPPARATQFLRDLRGDAAVHEAVAISTCNRTELYLVVGDPVEAETAALGMLARQAGIRPTELAGPMYALRNCDAARHLYRVTSGLESMVVGEAEVQGQIKRAHQHALESGTAGALTNRLFGAALATGKRVRTETGIGDGHLSTSSVAVSLAREELGELRGRHVVLLGAGETGELTAEALAAEGVETIFVANRRRDRALSLAKRFGGAAVSLDQLPAELVEADMVVASTASPHPILGEEEMAEVVAAREGRPLLMIDLAVPRDIETACGELSGVTLYDIDDLQAVINRNRRVRQAEARRAEGIVEEEIQHFAVWLGSLEVLPTVAALQERGREIALSVLAENEGRWESLSARDRDRLAALAQAIATRILHEPTVRMKQTRDDRVHQRTQVLRELFGLPEPEAAEEQPSEPAGADSARSDAEHLGRMAQVHRLPRRPRR
ncbi:MAG: glutamyl-tRNA reductase [Solirubrobacterales bacterium]|nr:glutamyl-tRNA reductase [Solirubrobacterales bacterium]